MHVCAVHDQRAHRVVLDLTGRRPAIRARGQAPPLGCYGLSLTACVVCMGIDDQMTSGSCLHTVPGGARNEVLQSLQDAEKSNFNSLLFTGISHLRRSSNFNLLSLYMLTTSFFPVFF